MLIVIRPRVSLTAAHRAHIPKWLSHSVAEWLELPIEWLLPLPSALIHSVQFSYIPLVYTVHTSIQGVSVPLNAASSGRPSFSAGGLVQLADLRLDSSRSHPTIASVNSIPFGEILFENPVSSSAVGSVQLAGWTWNNWIGRVDPPPSPAWGLDGQITSGCQQRILIRGLNWYLTTKPVHCSYKMLSSPWYVLIGVNRVEALLPIWKSD